MFGTVSGGGPDMNYWLGVKYSQLQQHADASTTQANSAATEAAARARLVGTEADANNAKLPFIAPAAAAAVKQTQAQTGLIGAQTNETNTLTPLRAQQLGLANDRQSILNRFLPARQKLELGGMELGNIGNATQLLPFGPGGSNPLTGAANPYDAVIRSIMMNSGYGG